MLSSSRRRWSTPCPLVGMWRTRWRRAACIREEPKRLVEAVGLDWARDGRKMPRELSGGMARRVFDLQLAQGNALLS